ncbi:MAG: hypothetical protein Tsb0013_03480 [Phycisphaerales bacterium]
MNDTTTLHDATCDGNVGHEAALHQLEEHTPEGVRPSERTLRRERRIFIPLTVCVVLAALGVLYWFGGWGATLIGMLLVIVYITIGWGAELLAARLRAKERRQLERTLNHRTGNHSA